MGTSSRRSTFRPFPRFSPTTFFPQVSERLGLKLSKEDVEQAKVDKEIVDRLTAALHQLKQCRSEDERVDYHVVLGAVAPKREKRGDHNGWMNAIFKRLRVTPGSRYVQKTGERRPRAPDQAVRCFLPLSMCPFLLVPHIFPYTRLQPCNRLRRRSLPALEPLRVCLLRLLS